MKTDRIYIKLSGDALSRQEIRAWEEDHGVGGIVLFEGLVRNQTQGKEVLRLEFEAYESMAISEMKKIAEKALNDFEIHSIAIHHRTGVLGLGEVPVLISVAAAHRDAAFKACRFAIDQLKETVPIWKKEIFSDGEVWVAAHP